MPVALISPSLTEPDVLSGFRRLVLHGLLPRDLLRLNRSMSTPPARRVGRERGGGGRGPLPSAFGPVLTSPLSLSRRAVTCVRAAIYSDSIYLETG